MTRPRQPTLRLLTLNIIGLQDKDKRRWLFSLLERDKWDLILLQDPPLQPRAWAQKGQMGSAANGGACFLVPPLEN